MNDERTTWCIPYARRVHRRGVALVVVLAVLTIMALLALVFSVLVMMEASSSSLNLAGSQAAMIAESRTPDIGGLENVRFFVISMDGWRSADEAGSQGSGRWLH